MVSARSPVLLLNSAATATIARVSSRSVCTQWVPIINSRSRKHTSDGSLGHAVANCIDPTYVQICRSQRQGLHNKTYQMHKQTELQNLSGFGAFQQMHQ